MGTGPDKDERRIRLVELLSVAAVLAVLAVLAIVVFADGDQPDRTTYAVAPAPAPAESTGFAEPAPAPVEVQPQPAPQTLSAPDETQREAGPSTAAGESPIVQVKPGRRVILRDAPGGDPVATVGDETEFGSPSVFSVVRHTKTWVAAPSPAMPDGQPAWIKADSRKLFGGYVDYAVHVDLSQRRAELLRHGVVVRRWPVTVGAAGSPTPTGTFAVTDLFRGNLNPAYGCCAVALTATQPNLPADWPGGNRIAIHGTDEPLGEAASHGCIRSADADVRRLVDTLPLGTPVKIDP